MEGGQIALFFCFESKGEQNRSLLKNVFLFQIVTAHLGIIKNQSL